MPTDTTMLDLCCGEASVASAIETSSTGLRSLKLVRCGGASVASAIETRTGQGIAAAICCCGEASVASAIETQAAALIAMWTAIVAGKQASRLRLKRIFSRGAQR